VEKLVDRPIFR